MKVYVIEANEMCEESLLCGVFVSRELAETAIETYKEQDKHNEHFKHLFRTGGGKIKLLDTVTKRAYDNWTKRMTSELVIHEFELNKLID